MQTNRPHETAGHSPDAFPPPSANTRFDRFRGEVMAGGSVTERDPAGEPFGGGSTGVIAGLGVLALFVWLGFTSRWMLLFALGILVSVFLHELGHFLTARMTGMKATQFFLGFGPRLFSFRRGETEYGVRLLPLGAFVRIIGMNNLDEVPPADEARTYRQKSYPRRMLVITAGSLMHLLLAAVLLFGVFATRGKLVDRDGAEIGAIAEGSGAEAAGIEPGDIVLSVGGVAVEDGDLGAAVRAADPGDTVDVVLERDGEQRTVTATLGENTTPGDLFGTALLGVTSRGATEWQDQSLGEAAGSMVTDLFPATWESTKGIVQVLNPVNIFEHLSGDSEDLATRPTTVVGVTQVSDDIGEMQGFAGILYLLAILNVFIGVFNMFPLLPLDGGHAAIATYERVREIGKGGGRYFTDVARLMPFTMGVIVVLLFLFMSGLYLDLTQPH
jgi:membrane-associated protease RseP (regulator of RpoE activity)